MGIRRIVEVLLLCLATGLTVLILMPGNILGEFGIAWQHAVYLLGFILLFALTRYARAMLVLVVLSLAVVVNLPSDMVGGLELNRSVVLATLGLIALGAIVNRIVRLLPTGLEEEPITRSSSSRGVGMLLAAIRQGDPARVRNLLRTGVNVDAEVDGQTPLALAVEQEHEEIVRMLLDAGARPDRPRHDGFTPIRLARHNGHEALAELLSPAEESAQTA